MRGGRRLVVTGLLAVLAGCGEGGAPDGPACGDLGEATLLIGAVQWPDEFRELRAGDTIELEPGRIGQRPFQLALRVSGVDTSAGERGLLGVEVLGFAGEFQVAGYYGQPEFAPREDGTAEALPIGVVADVDDELVDEQQVRFWACVKDACGRRAEAALVLTTVVYVPSY